MKTKLEEVAKVAKKKDQDGETSDRGKGKVDEGDINLEPDPPLTEEPFLKAIKALARNYLEGIPFLEERWTLNL